MSKISNVLLMIEYLSTGKKYSINELSQLLEVSPRMIRVYKDEIEKAGIFIETIKGPYGGYVLNQNVTVPKRFISPQTIELSNKDFYNIICRSIKEKRKCNIIYYSKDKKTTSKRIIHPYDIILLGKEWGIAAYCSKTLAEMSEDELKNRPDGHTSATAIFLDWYKKNILKKN